MKNQDNKYTLPASLTVEAAYIVPIALISITAVIVFGFKLHDTVVGNMTANEAAELYNYMPEDKADEAAVSQYGESRLKAVLSDIEYSLDIERYKDGSRVRLKYDGGERKYEAKLERPEKLMRRLTLTDTFADR